MRLTSTPGFAGLLSLGLAPASAEADTSVAYGEAVFHGICIACHYSDDPDPLMAAPPIRVARDRYADLGDRAAFVEAMAAYVRAPSEEAALMPEAVEEFGLMPPQEITEIEARAVAEYLFATDRPLAE